MGVPLGDPLPRHTGSVAKMRITMIQIFAVTVTVPTSNSGIPSWSCRICQ
jgi:hypothetical protein